MKLCLVLSVKFTDYLLIELYINWPHQITITNLTLDWVQELKQR